MAWDLALGTHTHDLTGGIASGNDEIIQRLKIRLWRHLGEWFLAVQAGMPWYNMGSHGTPGILGSKDISAAELRIRREVLETDGILRIVSMNTRYSGRSLSLTLQVLLADGSTQELNFEKEAA